MANLTLVIGNKNYSSWSLRPWLLLKHHAIEFLEVQLALDTPGFTEQASLWSSSSRVPVLADGQLRIWDSLAICEYLNETVLSGAGWPTAVQSRAMARSVCAEMHSGFAALRTEMPMNVRRTPRALQISSAAQADLARIVAIWVDCLHRSGGPWLFQHFSIADAFFAPVAFRLRAYEVFLEGVGNGYRLRLLNHPAMLEWEKQAKKEEHRIDAEER